MKTLDFVKIYGFFENPARTGHILQFDFEDRIFRTILFILGIEPASEPENAPERNFEAIPEFRRRGGQQNREDIRTEDEGFFQGPGIFPEGSS